MAVKRNYFSIDKNNCSPFFDVLALSCSWEHTRAFPSPSPHTDKHLLHSKGPQETCNQGRNGQQQLILNLSPRPPFSLTPQWVQSAMPRFSCCFFYPTPFLVSLSPAWIMYSQGKKGISYAKLFGIAFYFASFYITYNYVDYSQTLRIRLIYVDIFTRYHSKYILKTLFLLSRLAKHLPSCSLCLCAHIHVFVYKLFFLSFLKIFIGFSTHPNPAGLNLFFFFKILFIYF